MAVPFATSNDRGALHAPTNNGGCVNEQWFNGKRTMLQVSMNNGAMFHEQWCVFTFTSVEL